MGSEACLCSSFQGTGVQDLGSRRLPPVMRPARPRVHLHPKPCLVHLHHHFSYLFLQARDHISQLSAGCLSQLCVKIISRRERTLDAGLLRPLNN